jgi:Fur family ferric uptake transcriptional regulator
MPDRFAELRGRFTQHMRENKLKKTRQRDVILDVFLATDGHTTIDELLVRVQAVQSGVGYATVYRAMKLFVQAQVASERHFGEGPALYEPAEQDEHHDHLICTKCGRIFEFEDAVIEERQVDVAVSFGVTLSSHRMTLWGECNDEKVCVEYASRKK